MRITHDGRMWCESLNWETCEFERDMSYLARVSSGVDVEIDELDATAFQKHVIAARFRRFLGVDLALKAILWSGGRRINLVVLRGIGVESNFFQAMAQPVSTHGLNSDPRLYDIPLSAGLDELLAKRGNLMHGQHRWQLFFDPDVIENAREIAKGLPRSMLYANDEDPHLLALQDFLERTGRDIFGLGIEAREKVDRGSVTRNRSKKFK